MVQTVGSLCEQLKLLAIRLIVSFKCSRHSSCQNSSQFSALSIEADGVISFQYLIRSKSKTNHDPPSVVVFANIGRQSPRQQSDVYLHTLTQKRRDHESIKASGVVRSFGTCSHACARSPGTSATHQRRAGR